MTWPMKDTGFLHQTSWRSILTGVLGSLKGTLNRTVYLSMMARDTAGMIVTAGRKQVLCARTKARCSKTSCIMTTVVAISYNNIGNHDAHWTYFSLQTPNLAEHCLTESLM